VWSIDHSASKQYAVGMAEAASIESVPARLAAIREQLSLLSDYL
jgi:hypothetical protein